MRVIRINTGIATLIAVKAVYELIAQRPRVIYAGGLDPGKGADTGIRLAARLPECDFHIYGGNEDQIASLATQAPDNVGFHGHVDHGPPCRSRYRLRALRNVCKGRRCRFKERDARERLSAGASVHC